MKEVIFIIVISKEEALQLNKKGVPFGVDGMSTTKTRHKKYYLTELKKNLELLKKIRK